MIIRDSYPVQNYGRVIKCPRRGMGYEGVDCTPFIAPPFLSYQTEPGAGPGPRNRFLSSSVAASEDRSILYFQLMLPHACEKNWINSNKTVFDKRLLSIPARRQLSPLKNQRHADGPGTFSVKSPWGCNVDITHITVMLSSKAITRA